jgi:HSP20 family protein
MADLIRRDAVRDMVSLRDAMDRLFEESFVRPFGGFPRFPGASQELALDMYETDDDVVVEASLPGFKPDEVDIAVEGNTLTVKGEHEEKREEEQEGKYHYRERRYGSFQRSVSLPADIKADQAEATFENGVLKLTLPKQEESKPRRIQVEAR